MGILLSFRNYLGDFFENVRCFLEKLRRFLETSPMFKLDSESLGKVVA